MSITTSFELYYQRALLCKIVEVSFWVGNIRAKIPPWSHIWLRLLTIKSHPKNKTTSSNLFKIDLLIRLFSVRSQLLRTSIFVSLPPPSNMFKFGRFSYLTLSIFPILDLQELNRTNFVTSQVQHWSKQWVERWIDENLKTELKILCIYFWLYISKILVNNYKIRHITWKLQYKHNTGGLWKSKIS